MRAEPVEPGKPPRFTQSVVEEMFPPKKNPKNAEGKDRRRRGRKGQYPAQNMTGEPTPVVTLKLKIWEQFAKDKPAGEELLSWSEATAAKFGVTLNEVLPYLHMLVDYAERRVLLAADKEADRIAGAIGLTLTRALKVVEDAFTATKPQGESLTLFPDNMARLRAAELALRFMGRMAPQEIHVSHTHEHGIRAMSDEDLRAELKRLHVETGKVLEGSFEEIPETGA